MYVIAFLLISAYILLLDISYFNNHMSLFCANETHCFSYSLWWIMKQEEYNQTYLGFISTKYYIRVDEFPFTNLQNSPKITGLGG